MLLEKIIQKILMKIQKKFFEGRNFYIAVFGTSVFVLAFMYVFSYFVDLHTLQAYLLAFFN